MYLDHFGLNEPPFRITPVTVFFFSGANRGEILDALIYSISEVEGIIKVSGEVGSGKTMLCRMLLEKLPAHIEAIYLANPSLTREEMLYAIADGLGLNIKDERVGIIMQNIQNKLEEKAREGKRIVVLVDEAHAMPVETLEELRLLYNLQMGNAKLMQIVLFGQPELNIKLERPNMRQLKDRIAHHFHMQPLTQGVLENYLMFRMRAAGYHGPNIFSNDAIKLIAEASNGLMRRVNILADKSLLAAFVEDTHNIEVRHVKAAMRDSEMEATSKSTRNKMVIGSAFFTLIAASLVGWILIDDPISPAELKRVPDHVYAGSVEPIAPPQQPTTTQQDTPISTDGDIDTLSKISPKQAPLDNHVEQAALGTSHQEQTKETIIDSESASTPSASNQAIAKALIGKSSPVSVKQASASPAINAKQEAPETHSLFSQRLSAGKQLAEQKKVVASLQLFYNEEIRPERIEGFLKRADGLGVLSEIYLLPAKFGRKDGLRVLFGAYSSIEEARIATSSLPTRYKNAFATSIYLF